MGFSIDDRSTWDWRDGGVVNTAWFVDGYTFTPDPGNPTGFYQLVGDHPVRQSGATGTTFGYDTAGGHLISQPSDMDDVTQFNRDTYQWCLDNGLVVQDQR